METAAAHAHPAIALIQSSPLLFCRRGAVVATWRQHAGQRYGPYYRLAYREDGRQRAVYLGREGPLVETVRQQLAQLHGHLAQRRAEVRAQRQIDAMLRAQKRRLNQMLAAAGLRLQGWEVRGWRSCSLARLVPGFSRVWNPPLSNAPRPPAPPALPTFNQLAAGAFPKNLFGRRFRQWREAQRTQNWKNANSVDQKRQPVAGERLQGTRDGP